MINFMLHDLSGFFVNGLQVKWILTWMGVKEGIPTAKNWNQEGNPVRSILYQFRQELMVAWGNVVVVKISFLGEGQGGSLKNQMEGNEMGSKNIVHPLSSFIFVGPCTFHWTEDHVLGPSIKWSKNRQPGFLTTLTVASFPVDDFFMSLTVRGRGNREYITVPMLLLPFMDTVETTYGLIIRCFTAA